MDLMNTLQSERTRLQSMLEAETDLESGRSLMAEINEVERAMERVRNPQVWNGTPAPKRRASRWGYR